MPFLTRRNLAALAALTVLTTQVSAQDVPLTDRPTVFVPARPQTRQDEDHREARALYGLAMLRQRQDRLVEAMRHLENATSLDPDAPAPHRALIPLYLALSRGDDALAECERTLELEPDDFQTGYLFAQQLRRRGQSKAARATLNKALHAPGLGERLDLRIQMCYDLGAWSEEAQEFNEAVAAFEQVARVLDNPKPLLDIGAFDVQQLAEQATTTYERMIKVCIQAKA